MILLTFNIYIPEINSRKSGYKTIDQLIKSIEKNTAIIAQHLEMHEMLATFFVEISVTESLQKLLKTLSFAGHEIAFYNINSDENQIKNVKENLEKFLEKPIRGLRQKLHRLPYPVIQDMDFGYVSNIEHSNINFLWRKLTEKSEIFIENNLTIVPESQSPYSQLPFNDYVFQVIPMKYYENMLLESLKNSEFVMIYLNAWQFYDKNENPFKLPFYKQFNLGRKMQDRLEEFLQFIDEQEIATARMKDYLF